MEYRLYSVIFAVNLESSSKWAKVVVPFYTPTKERCPYKLYERKFTKQFIAYSINIKNSKMVIPIINDLIRNIY